MSDIKKVALVGNSNPRDNIQDIYDIKQLLNHMGLEVILSPTLFENTLFNGKKKAQMMNTYYADHTIHAIFDISGGDIANGVLDNLDYSLISNQYKVFYGYSDVTTLLNSIIRKRSECRIISNHDLVVGSKRPADEQV